MARAPGGYIKRVMLTKLGGRGQNRIDPNIRVCFVRDCFVRDCFVCSPNLY